jgi:hypothetical protein
MIFPGTIYKNTINGSTAVILNSCGKLTIDMRLKNVGKELRYSGRFQQDNINVTTNDKL